jgi:hypothetical protein
LLRDHRLLIGVTAVVAALCLVAGVVVSSLLSTTVVASSDPARRPAGSPRKQAYIEQADRLCSRADRRQQSLPAPESLAGYARYSRRINAINRRQMASFRKLERPRRDRQVLDRYLATARRAVAVVREVGVAAEQGDEAGVRRALGRAEKLRRRLDVLALRYGFDECRESN